MPPGVVSGRDTGPYKKTTVGRTNVLTKYIYITARRRDRAPSSIIFSCIDYRKSIDTTSFSWPRATALAVTAWHEPSTKLNYELETKLRAHIICLLRAYRRYGWRTLCVGGEGTFAANFRRHISRSRGIFYSSAANNRKTSTRSEYHAIIGIENRKRRYSWRYILRRGTSIALETRTNSGDEQWWANANRRPKIGESIFRLNRYLLNTLIVRYCVKWTEDNRFRARN